MSEVLTLTYGYTAKDLAAVRAYVQRVAPAIIARTYYDPDEDAFASTHSAIERHLRTLLDGLVKVAIEQGSPALAEHLRASIKKHGEPKLTAVTFRMVTEAATLAAAAPHASHSIGRWFRPRIASRLKGEGIATIGDLVAFCMSNDESRPKSVPKSPIFRFSRRCARNFFENQCFRKIDVKSSCLVDRWAANFARLTERFAFRT